MTDLEALSGRGRGGHVEQPRRLGGRCPRVLRRVGLSQPRATQRGLQSLRLSALLELEYRFRFGWFLIQIIDKVGYSHSEQNLKLKKDMEENICKQHFLIL